MDARIKLVKKHLKTQLAKRRQAVQKWALRRLFREPENAICTAINTLTFSPERVISNYLQGAVLFGEGENGLLWKSFPKRAIITPDTAHIPKKLRSLMKRNAFEVRINSNFNEVILACKRDYWTWINDPVIEIYQKLFAMGFVRSHEVYRNGELVGGDWGLIVGSTYTGMSMFHRVDNAGAYAVATVMDLLSKGTYAMVDCGVMNANVPHFGAIAITREAFIEKVVQGLASPAVLQSAQPEPNDSEKRVYDHHQEADFSGAQVSP